MGLDRGGSKLCGLQAQAELLQNEVLLMMELIAGNWCPMECPTQTPIHHIYQTEALLPTMQFFLRLHMRDQFLSKTCTCTLKVSSKFVQMDVQRSVIDLQRQLHLRKPQVLRHKK